jgi:hypothetical protein
VLAPRFGVFQVARRRPEPHGGFELARLVPEIRSPYADLRLLDLDGDRRDDLVASSGQVFLRRADGSIPEEPSFRLPAPDADDWTFLAVGDFNADGRPDVVLLSYGMRRARADVFYHTGEPGAPFTPAARATIDLEGASAPRDRRTLLRDSPPVADWDGDGVADLIVGKGQENRVLVLRGGREGLDPARSLSIPLEFRLHFETGLHVADFDGDRRPDLAAFGDTKTGVGAGGPLAVYIVTRSPRPKDVDDKR